MAEWIADRKDVTSTVDGDFVLYKNRPLVREDNVICYGNVSDKYILQMIIMSETEFKGRKVPDKVYIQLISTDPSVSKKERVIKEAMKTGLYEALDVGVTWLERYLVP
ncbi:MAG: hypothetical protein ACI4V1_09100 [Eubacteriales bacterium]